MWHVAGDQLNEIVSGWWQLDANFAEISSLHIVNLLVFCKPAGATFFQIKR
jgi:hypothetical protein